MQEEHTATYHMHIHLPYLKFPWKHQEKVNKIPPELIMNLGTSLDFTVNAIRQGNK